MQAFRLHSADDLLLCLHQHLLWPLHSVLCGYFINDREPCSTDTSPIQYIKQYAELKGMSPKLSQYLLPIINAASEC
jgi:hypothetical protein